MVVCKLQSHSSRTWGGAPAQLAVGGDDLECDGVVDPEADGAWHGSVAATHRVSSHRYRRRAPTVYDTIVFVCLHYMDYILDDENNT